MSSFSYSIPTCSYILRFFRLLPFNIVDKVAVTESQLHWQSRCYNCFWHFLRNFCHHKIFVWLHKDREPDRKPNFIQIIVRGQHSFFFSFLFEIKLAKHNINGRTFNQLVPLNSGKAPTNLETEY